MSKIQKFFIGFLSLILVLVTGVSIFAANFYLDVKKSVEQTNQPTIVKRVSTGVERTESVDLGQRDPFSVLLLGVDTGGEERTDQGRADTMIFVTVNPDTQKTTLTSIARDTYLEIVGAYVYDKANHSYAYGGASMAMDTIENFLGVPVDHFIAINFQGLEDLVDALNGIELNNRFKFNVGDAIFEKGRIKMDGKKALTFARMRYDDPDDDYGRQRRQQDVIEAIAKKGLSLNGVTQYQKVLKALSTNMSTDLSFDQIQQIALKYQDAFTNIATDQIYGEELLLNGISYQSVSEEELYRVRQSLQTQLGIENQAEMQEQSTEEWNGE